MTPPGGLRRTHASGFRVVRENVQRGGGGGGPVAQSCLTLATPRTGAGRAPPCMGFSRQEYWGGLPFPSPDLPHPGIEPTSAASQAVSLPAEPSGEPTAKRKPLKSQDEPQSPGRKGEGGGLFNKSEPHCYELRAANLHLGFKTPAAPSGAHMTVGGSGSHGTAQAGPGHRRAPLLGPGVWGTPSPQLHVVKSGRPAVLRAGLKLGHRGWKNLADISPQEWGLSDHQRECSSSAEVASRQGLVSVAICFHPRAAGPGSGFCRDGDSRWQGAHHGLEGVSEVRPSRGWMFQEAGPGTPSAHPPGGGHLRAEAQPRPSQPLPSSSQDCFPKRLARWPWPLA